MKIKYFYKKGKQMQKSKGILNIKANNEVSGKDLKKNPTSSDVLKKKESKTSWLVSNFYFEVWPVLIFL